MTIGRTQTPRALFQEELEKKKDEPIGQYDFP
jgi:hypothetical protein